MNRKSPKSPVSELAHSVARLAAWAIVPGLASTSHAQSAPASSPTPEGGDGDLVKLPELTVDGTRTPPLTSPKFTAPVRDVPQTVQIISATVIEEQGATSLRDVLRNTPGITFQAGEGGGGLPGDKFTMRGFSAENDILIDGVRDVGAYSRDSYNLEQVEVIKGPSSAVSGRGATGGSINLVTKSPQTSAFQRGTLGVGTEGYGRATADVNQPLAREDAAVRLNAMWTTSGVAGRDIVENHRWGIAPSLALGLGQSTRWNFDYQHLEQDNIPDYGVPSAALDDPLIEWGSFYGLRDYDYEDVRSDIATARVEHDIASDFTLRSVVRYGWTDRDSAITAPRPPNRQLQQRTMSNEVWAAQTSLTGGFETSSLRHAFVAGIEGAHETTDNRNRAQSTNQPPVDLYHPDPTEAPLGPMPPNTGNPSTTRARTLALYACDTVRVAEQWQVAAGLRVDDFDVDYRQRDLANGAQTDLESGDTLLTGRVGVVYNPRPNGSVYLGYSTAAVPTADGGNTGTGLSDNPNAVNNPNLDPEETYNVELGTKWDLAENRLALSAALFRTEKTNARTRNANDEPYVLDGRQRVDGVELGVTGRLNDRWTAVAAVAAMRSEIVESANPDEQGNDLARTPELTASLWTTYEFPGGITLGAGAQYMDAVFRSTTNLTQTVPDYWLFDVMASCAVNETLMLRLNLDNLTDERYVDRVGGGHQIPGPGRSAVLSAAFRF
jgi:catecholate siderophore receptor